jgi:hypothetical protein
MRSGSHYRVSCCSVQTSCSNDRGFLRIATGLYDPEAAEAALTNAGCGGVNHGLLGGGDCREAKDLSGSISAVLNADHRGSKRSSDSSS